MGSRYGVQNGVHLRALDPGGQDTVEGPKGRPKGYGVHGGVGIHGGVPNGGPEMGQFGGPEMTQFGVLKLTNLVTQNV